MSEPIKVFVYLWKDDDGSANCDLFRNVPAFTRSMEENWEIPPAESTEAALEAMESPGVGIPFGDDGFVRYCTVQEAS